jgi:fructose-bisphosphate aldolase/6-deoxy-5-ketofructose 1-phosphate synthase
MIFAGDQKVEHLNDDFFGPGVHADDADPEHMFRIADKSKIGLFASQLGLIARFGMDYRDVNYLIKVNSKTNIVKTEQSDPLSRNWFNVAQVVEFAKMSELSIPAIGYTIYLGSENESEMLREAARLVYDAHAFGLLAVLWMYPRGKAVKDERDPHLIAGAAGVAGALGADFVKVNFPKGEGARSSELLKEAVMAAGRTGVICAGGSEIDAESFLQRLYDQIHIGGAMGNATGRNIHQRSMEEAIRLCNAIFSITVENSSVSEAISIYKKKT